MIHTDFEPTAEERRYLLDRTAEKLACKYADDLELLYPEMVCALLKCDLRTLIKRGLETIKISPKVMRVRKIDLVAFIAACSAKPKLRPIKRHDKPIL